MTSTDVVERSPAQDLVARVRGEEFQSQLALGARPGFPTTCKAERPPWPAKTEGDRSE